MKLSLSKQALIYNLPIILDLGKGERIKVNIPSMAELLEDIELDSLVKVLSSSLEELSSNSVETGFVFSTYSGLFVTLYHTDSVLKAPIEKLFEGTTLTPQGLFYKEKELDENTLWYLTHIIKVGCGYMSYEEFTKTEVLLEESEVAKRIRESEERINKIRSKRENKAETFTAGPGVSPEDGIISILSMIPGITLTEVISLNVFGFNWFYNYAVQLAYDRISVVAAGNGLLGKNKQYKFVTDKSVN